MVPRRHGTPFQICRLPGVAIALIQRLTTNMICSQTWTFRVEITPRRGHLITVSAVAEPWVGIYRYDTRLYLLTRCQGDPPREISIDAAEIASILAMIAALGT